MEHFGIDISEKYGKIDWQTLLNNNDNLEFVMLRATYGLSGIDGQFFENTSNLSKTNLKIGAYHECFAQSIQEAISEAKYFLKVVKSQKISYPLAVKISNEFDIEMGKDFTSDILAAFCNVISENNYTPLIYLSKNMFEHVNFDKIKGIKIWACGVSNQLLDIFPYNNIAMLRFFDYKKIAGINQKANLDISYIDYPINNFSKGDNMAEADNFYTVKSGDTLQNLAEKILGNSADYKKIMELNNLTKAIIYPGQTIRIPSGNNQEITFYRVKPGDTLWHISTNFLGYGPRYNEIMAINNLSTDMIYPGQILKIPKK